MFTVKSNFANSSTDRFIPRRIGGNFSLVPTQNDEDVNRLMLDHWNSAKTRYNQNNFQKALQHVLLPNVKKRVLQFSSPKRTRKASSVRMPDWPVKPRRKPAIGSPKCILDMPQFDTNISHNVADWSSKNCLGTIFEGEVHMWHAFNNTNRDVSRTNTMVKNCVRFNEDGTQMAFGLSYHRIGVWDIASRKMVGDNFCCRIGCNVNAIEWISSMQLLTGCSNGVLNLLDIGLGLSKMRSRKLADAIINIVRSCNKRFVATCSLDHAVTVWRIPELSEHIVITFEGIVKAVSFHPWKESLLATGGPQQDRVRLWNINAHKQVAFEKNIYNDCTVDCLSFNPTSGELVVTYCVPEDTRRNSFGCGIISVLTDMDKVVEELHVAQAPIPYLLWGNEGAVLAAISDDENLSIWEFFGEKQCAKPKLMSKHYPAFIPFGTTIR